MSEITPDETTAKLALKKLMAHDGVVTFDENRIFHDGKLIGLLEFNEEVKMWQVHQEHMSFFINPFAVLIDND